MNVSTTPVASQPDLIRAFLAGRDEPCPKCGYNLRDATGDVCPECGAPVRLTLERSVMPRIAVWLAVVVLIGQLGLTVWGAAEMLLIILGGSTGYKPSDWLAWLSIAQGIASIAWCSTWLIVAIHKGRSGPRGAAGRSLVIAALGLMAFDTVIWLLREIGFAWFGL